MELVPESQNAQRKHFLWLPLRLFERSEASSLVCLSRTDTPVPSVLRAHTQSPDPTPSALCVLTQAPFPSTPTDIELPFGLGGVPSPHDSLHRGLTCLGSHPGPHVVGSWNAPSIFLPLVLDPTGWPFTSLIGKSPPLYCHGPRPHCLKAKYPPSKFQHPP